MWGHQQNQRQQQQDAARGRELLEHRPEEFLHDMQMAAAMGEALWSFGLDVFRIEAIAGAGLGFELRPELADLETLGDAAPEGLQPHAERDVWRGRLSSGWGSGGHGVREIIED